MPTPDTSFADQITKLRRQLMQSMQLIDGRDEHRILELAAIIVPSLGGPRLCGVYVIGQGWTNTGGPCTDGAVRADLEAQLAVLERIEGAVTIPRVRWGWAVALRTGDDLFGYLVVCADDELSPEDKHLLRVLGQQTGIALAVARDQAGERAETAELRVANAALAGVVETLEHIRVAHDRLDQVAVTGGGPVGVARVLHQLTGLPVAVEDRHGNLRAWTGPDPPEVYLKDPTGRRELVLDQAHRERRPIRADTRLMAPAWTDDDEVLGVLVLMDPTVRARAEDVAALTHGATVLTIELRRLREVAVTELRLGRDLVDELVTGTEDEPAFARAQALGYDLARPHRVLVVESSIGADEQVFLQAVRRAARTAETGSLLTADDGAVVVLADSVDVPGAESPWERLHAAIVAEPGGGMCRIGVGGTCERPADFARSHREARLALEMHAVTGGPDRAITVGELGVYRLFAEASHIRDLERFAREWLGPLLDYDNDTRSHLVTTLSTYLECGGHYDATATTMGVHRSTVKYRLRRIREIGGRDLADPDTHFNLQLATRAWQTLVALHDI